MDDKIYDLLEKVYIELQDTKKEVKSNSNHIIRLETEFHNKIGALSDEMAIVRDDIVILKDDVAILKDDVAILKDDVAVIKDKLDIIEDKVDKHDIKIQVIEGGKKDKKKTI
jgi:predicted nuclease with TOPRIM domain